MAPCGRQNQAAGKGAAAFGRLRLPGRAVPGRRPKAANAAAPLPAALARPAAKRQDGPRAAPPSPGLAPPFFIRLCRIKNGGAKPGDSAKPFRLCGGKIRAAESGPYFAPIYF